MSADDRHGPSELDEQDRLSGWKEISAFLGRSVRTTQRWEREYGLPVRRLGREGGGIVLASRRELTAWMQDSARRAAEAATFSRDEPRGVPISPDPILPGRDRAGRRAFQTLAGVVGIIALSALGIWRATPAGPAPADWAVSAGVLRVYDVRGRELWHRRFESPLHDGDYVPAAGARGFGGFVTVRDIDGDGRPEVLFGKRSAARHESMGFYVFEANGLLRFRLSPQHRVSFGGTAYSGPWIPWRVFIDRGTSGKPALRFVFVHGDRFPTLLLETDARGRTRSEYWSNGHIETVTSGRWKGREVLVVGGSHDDTGGGSLAIFEDGRAEGSAPAERAAYRCDDCPPGRHPSVFLVFPPPCPTRLGGSTASISDAWIERSGRLSVQVAMPSHGDQGPFESAVAYKLRPDLTVEWAEFTAGLRTMHEAWYREGRLDHPLGPQDEANVYPVRLWQESGFVAVPPGPVHQR